VLRVRYGSGGCRVIGNVCSADARVSGPFWCPALGLAVLLQAIIMYCSLHLACSGAMAVRGRMATRKEDAHVQSVCHVLSLVHELLGAHRAQGGASGGSEGGDGRGPSVGHGQERVAGDRLMQMTALQVVCEWVCCRTCVCTHACCQSRSQTEGIAGERGKRERKRKKRHAMISWRARDTCRWPRVFTECVLCIECVLFIECVLLICRWPQHHAIL